MTLVSRAAERVFKFPAAETHAVDLSRNLPIPMEDGVSLLADRYAPRGVDRPPLVMVRSPYGRRGFPGLLFGRMFAERGFQVLIQSCRGTFGSGGVFDPFVERDDGIATVEWMRRQDWYPGAFATNGPSYLTLVQWAIAGDNLPDHKAMAIQVAAANLPAGLFEGGSFCLETAMSWIDFVAHQEGRLALLRPFWAPRRLRPIFDNSPLADLDRLAIGRTAPDWQGWLAHDEPGDEFWKTRSYADALTKVQKPLSILGGWHDFFLARQMQDYAALRAAGQVPQLTIGPWRHTQATVPAALESLAWLRGELLDDHSSPRAAPVRVFVTGADEWRDLEDWPPPGQPQTWYLHPGGRLASEPAGASEPDRYTYDPTDPTPSVAGPVGDSGKPRVDNRAHEARPDVLTYTSPPLERDQELIGQATVDLCVSSDREHTDFFARLCDVTADGESINICDAIVRLSPGRPEPEPDGTAVVRLALWPTAHRFLRGHRLRLQISSGAHPRYARNPGSGEALGTATTMLAAHQSVHHDAEHNSQVVLPLADA